MIAIVDYGIGNVFSIYNMLKKIGLKSVVTADKHAILSAEKIILPGIGAFDHCMQQLNNSGLRPAIEQKVIGDQTPVLGVCVGCQMLMESSDEGSEKGLGWVKGRVVKFDKQKMPQDYKIPHMSWSDTVPSENQSLYTGIENPRFYFVHSYHLEPEDPSVITATAEYGYTFPASVGSKNIQGVQFHPEKSHKFGMKLYSNFQNNFS